MNDTSSLPFGRRWITAICVFVISFGLAEAPHAAADSEPESSYSINPGVPWPGTDALGRVLPLSESVGGSRPNRWVGIFYFINIGEKYDYGPFDATKIIAEHPEALTSSDCPFWGLREKHKCFWGEPLYGYYNTTDPWVLRRHAHLLADAGVDTLIFDTTNAVTHRDVYLALCDVFAQVRKEGEHTPQICFMVNTAANKTATEIYDDLYKPGRYSELWFRWEGKPLMLCDPARASPELKAFFTLRGAHWPNTLVNTPYAWHWESTYPQVYGYTDDPNKPEEVNVAVAQNLRASDGAVTQMKFGDGRGRSFHDGHQDPDPSAINRGPDFQEQWERALKLDPPFVMITGWNEWTANITNNIHDEWMFGDQFTQEYSRDIEPMKGGHGDNYYMQMVANIRKYKGVPLLPKPSATKTIRIDGSFDQWADVEPEFAGHVGNTIPQDHFGFGSAYYTNKTGRNSLRSMKVARDEKNIYFYARTAAPLTPRTDPNWMMLLIGVGSNAKDGWEGFNYVVNRTPPGEKTAVLETSGGGWNWKKSAEVACSASGNEIQIAVPRAKLGLDAQHTTLDFKWIDNVQHPGDPMDLYISGDTAPQGRFRFRYQAD